MKSYALFVLVLVIFIFECCAHKTDVSKTKFGASRRVDRTVEVHKPGEISFVDDVKPILENRCGVCHSCYDAPCQLKLTSFEGLERGATTDPLYNSTRLTAMSPTRLFIDEQTTRQWRKRGFHPIINERRQTPQINLENSVINLMLTLKQTHPQPQTVLLPSSFDISLDKDPICPTVEKFSDYKEKYPLWGMPYALPGLTKQEHDTITTWLEEGAKTTLPPPLSPKASETISKWETFLNGKSLKEQLMSRYIYEHLFIGHIHFDNLPDREFYRLVRSSTAPGETVDEIATVRPYDDPITRHFYYRFRRIEHAIPVKNHTVYHMNDALLARYTELFLTPDYEVKKLPGYKAEIAANPFKTFEAIPAKSRYKFMLDNARFFVMGFIKGPVCRGQVALNVINDHFFVAFFDPEKDDISNDSAFLARVSDNLALPSEKKSNLNILSLWTDFRKRQNDYLEEKEKYLMKLHPDNVGNDITQIWNGDGENRNALLTVFRHFDSASVEYGFLGKAPDTGWIIDYPLLERIHYLLVAGFNVFGNVVHQTETRLYMDFLRLEGENAFLSFLPKDQRKKIWERWYDGAKREARDYLNGPYMGLERSTQIRYETDTPIAELFEKIIDHAGDAAGPIDYMNRCPTAHCVDDTTSPLEQKADRILQQATHLGGREIQVVQDIVFLHVETGREQDDLAYTVIRNKALSNNSFLFGEDRRRIVKNDTLTILKGHKGSYPNTFVRVHIDKLEEFVSDFLHIKDQVGFYHFAKKYAVTRTNKNFWKESDWHHKQFRKEDPIESGLFDMYRLNRIALKSDTSFKW